MINKLECTCIEAYKTRKMRDPNCCACSCDHNALVEQLEKANERLKELEKRISPLLETDDGLHSKESCDAAMIGQLRNQLANANERVKELEKNQPPIENGKNRYGLDVSYFRNVINRELNRPLANHKPDELARVFARLSHTANESVIFEPEFSNKFAIENQVKALEAFANYAKGDDWEDAHLQEAIKIEIEQLRKEQQND